MRFAAAIVGFGPRGLDRAVALAAIEPEIAVVAIPHDVRGDLVERIAAAE